MQGSRTKVEQHAQALAAAHLSLSAAATTATRTEELVEELSCDLRTEQEARKVRAHTPSSCMPENLLMEP